MRYTPWKRFAASTKCLQWSLSSASFITAVSSILFRSFFTQSSPSSGFRDLLRGLFSVEKIDQTVPGPIDISLYSFRYHGKIRTLGLLNSLPAFISSSYSPLPGFRIDFPQNVSLETQRYFLRHPLLLTMIHNQSMVIGRR